MGNIDCGGEGGGEDLVDAAGDAHGGELFEVVGAGLCGVVCYEDCAFACGWELVSNAHTKV